MFLHLHLDNMLKKKTTKKNQITPKKKPKSEKIKEKIRISCKKDVKSCKLW
jgi:hypothetical protein